MIAYAPTSVLVRPGPAGRGDHRRRPGRRRPRAGGGRRPADRGAAAPRPLRGPGRRLVRNLRVPYDRADPAAGTIPINFEWYPAEQDAGGHDRGHGGRPRLPEHRQPRLLHRAVRRPAAHPQPAAGRQPRHRHLRADQLPAAAALAPRPRRRGTTAAWRLRRPAQHRPALPGGGLHGSDLYGTANAARDLADVLAALQTGPVDLYGDSYGSYFGQTFAARYPRLLRSRPWTPPGRCSAPTRSTSRPSRPPGSPST